jgi:hypothetical protein
MTLDQTAAFLAKLGSSIAPSQNRKGWFVAKCPLAPWSHDDGKDKNPSFACKDEPGDAGTNCFSCGWHGPMAKLVLRMQELNRADPQVEVKWGEALQLIIDAEDGIDLDLDYPDLETVLAQKKQDLHLFPDWWIDTFAPWNKLPWSCNYLHERRVSPALCDRLGLRIDTEQKRICFPVRDFQHRLVGLHGRCVHENVTPRYRMYSYAKQNNPIVWLGEDWVDVNRPILVVEGPFDLASCLRVYDNVVSPLFATPNAQKVRRMGDAIEWVTLFDRGGGGDAGRARISSVLGREYIVTHLQPPEHRKDPGVMSVPELQALLGDHLQLIAHFP